MKILDYRGIKPPEPPRPKLNITLELDDKEVGYLAAYGRESTTADNLIREIVAKAKEVNVFAEAVR